MGGWVVGMGGRGQGGCERRIEVFGKIQKKNWWGVKKKYFFFFWGGGGVGSWGRVRVDVMNEELKFWEKKNNLGGSGGGRVGVGVGLGGSGWM